MHTAVQFGCTLYHSKNPLWPADVATTAITSDFRAFGFHFSSNVACTGLFFSSDKKSLKIFVNSTTTLKFTYYCVIRNKAIFTFVEPGG